VRPQGIAGHQNRWPDLFDIGARKAAIHADGVQSVVPFVRAGKSMARDHRAGIGAPAVCLFQHRAMGAHSPQRCLPCH
jgi:hypothetical protein